MPSVANTNRLHDMSSRSKGKQSVIVAVTVDVDADSILAGEGQRDAHPSRASEARFGIKRGLHRLVRILSERSVPATFFVPGFVADEYSVELGDISPGAHEVGHHGYFHRDCSKLNDDEQRVEFEMGMEALHRRFGVYPIGYRAPFFELTPVTAELIADSQVYYDSSCMGDDAPYYERVAERYLLELPVHWILDDGVYYAWTPTSPGLSGSSALYEAWIGEYESARPHGGFLNFVLHPQWSGRRQAAATFARLLDHLIAADDVRFASLSTIADDYRSRHPAPTLDEA